MTQRCIQVLNGTIQNIIIADPASFVTGDGSLIVAAATGNPGDAYANGVITPAAPLPPQVPESVAGWQAKGALQTAGLLDKANAAVASSGSAGLQQYWANAQVILRDDPAIVKIGAALGLTSAQIDALFIEAAAIGM